MHSVTIFFQEIFDRIEILGKKKKFKKKKKVKKKKVK